MLKYIGNAFHSILPSVIATVIGAYIVNTYIVSKNETPPAPAVAVAPPADPKKTEDAVAAKPAAAPAESSAAEAPKSKPADKPVSARAHQPNAREKLSAEKAPAKPTPVPAPAPAPVTAAAPVEAAPARDRDANDLARAAIERLRNSSASSEQRAAEPAARPLELPRTPEVAHAASAPAVVPVAAAPLTPAPVSAAPMPAAPVASAAPVAPLPPAVSVAPPVAAAVEPAPHPVTTASVPPRVDDPSRPTPPAEIPAGDRVEASADTGRSVRTVGDDMVSAARTVFHAVIPR